MVNGELLMARRASQSTIVGACGATSTIFCRFHSVSAYLFAPSLALRSAAQHQQIFVDLNE
jgi:hypothetical protein